MDETPWNIDFNIIKEKQDCKTGRMWAGYLREREEGEGD
jgi:hypothetical protein